MQCDWNLELETAAATKSELRHRWSGIVDCCRYELLKCWICKTRIIAKGNWIGEIFPFHLWILYGVCYKYAGSLSKNRKKKHFPMMNCIYWIQFNLWFWSVFNSIFFRHILHHVKHKNSQMIIVSKTEETMFWHEQFSFFSLCRFPSLTYLVNIIVLLVLFFVHAMHNISNAVGAAFVWFDNLFLFFVISIDLCATAYNDQKKPNGVFLLTSQSVRTQVSSIQRFDEMFIVYSSL